MSSEVGNGFVAIVPRFTGFRKAVSAEVDGASKLGASRFSNGFKSAGAAAGTTVGTGFKKAFQSSTQGVGSDTIARLARDVANQSRALSAARLKEQDATGKVRVAETQLAAARARANADAARVTAAEDALAAARAKYATGSAQVQRAEQAVTAARAKQAAGATGLVRAEEGAASAARSLGAAELNTKAASQTLTAAQSKLADATANAGATTEKSAQRITSAFKQIIAGSAIGSAIGTTLSNTLSRVTSALGSGIRNAIGGTIKVAADFQQQISSIGAVSGATVTQLDGLRATALRIGKDTSFSASEAAKAMEELVKAGVPLPAVMRGAADATVALAAASGVSLPEAATISANAMNQFGIKAAGMGKVVDLIAGAANASAIDVGQFGYSLSQVGAVANASGVSFKDTAVAIAEMGNAGIVGADAGTSLKSMFGQLTPASKRSAEAFANLGLLTKQGTSAFFDQQGKVKSLAQIQELLRKGTVNLSDAQKTLLLKNAFGTDAMRAAAVLSKEGAAGFNQLAAAMGKVTAAEVAAKRLDNLKGAVESLKGSVETVAIGIGSVLLPALRFIVAGANTVIGAISDRLTPRFEALGKVFETTAGLLDDVFSPVLANLGKRFGAFVDGGLKRLADGFNALNAVLGGPDPLNASAILGAVGKIFPGFDNLLNVFKLLTPLAPALSQALADLGPAIAPILPSLAKAALSLLPALEKIVLALLPLIPPLAKTIEALAPVVSILADALVWLIDFALAPIAQQLQDVTGFFSGAVTPARILADALSGKLGPGLKIAADLMLGFKDKLSAVLGVLSNPGAAIAAFVGQLAQLPAKAVAALGDLGAKLAGSGKAMIDGLIAGAKGAVPALSAFVASIPGKTVAALGDLGAKLAGSGKAIIDGLIAGGRTAIPALAQFAVGIPGRILAGIGDLGSKLIPLGGALITGLIRGATTAAPRLLAFVATLPGKALAALGNIGGKLVGSGAALITGLVRGSTQTGPRLGSYVSTLPGAALRSLGAIGQKLLGAGRALVQGLINGARAMFGTFRSQVGTLPNQALSSLGGIGSKLVGAGRALIDGLIRGARATFGAFTAAIRSLPGAASSALGNIGSRLFSSGQSLIGGFVNGIRAKIGAIRAAVADVLAAAKRFFPNSPAKEGPFSGKGWTAYSGRAVADDWAGGMDGGRSTVRTAARRLMEAGAITGSLDAASATDRQAAALSAALSASGAGRTTNLTYVAAPNQSKDSDADLWDFMHRTNALVG